MKNATPRPPAGNGTRDPESLDRLSYYLTSAVQTPGFSPPAPAPAKKSPAPAKKISGSGFRENNSGSAENFLGEAVIQGCK